MKNLIIALFLCLPIFAFAQNQSLEAFYTKYMEMDDVTDINLEGFLLNMVAKFANDDSETDILTKITKLRVMIVDEENQIDPEDVSSLVKNLRQQKFEDLMQIRDGKSRIDFMIREADDKISNILMIVNDKESFILLSLEGNLSWKDIKELNIDVEGGEHLKKIPRA